MIRAILQIGNPALRQVADPVDVDQIQSDEIQALIDDLIETMRDANERFGSFFNKWPHTAVIGVSVDSRRLISPRV